MRSKGKLVALKRSARQNTLALLRPMNLQGSGSLHKNHEYHIAGKGMNSLSRYNIVHKFIPMPQAMKVPDAKAAVDKEWEEGRWEEGVGSDEVSAPLWISRQR